MRTGTVLLVATAATFQGASATFGWRALKGFSVPGNSINICTPEMEKGFDWSDMAEGVIEKYKGFNFKGCKIFGGKGKGKFGKKDRGLEARTFGKWLHADVEVGNYINEISSDKGFSIGSFGLSSDDYDGDLDFEFGGYEGDEGRTCNKKIRVGKKETEFKNDQCGGAKTVKVKIPKGSLIPKCILKIASIKFECNTKTKSIPIPTSTLPFSYTVPAAETTPASDCELPPQCQGFGALLPGCQLPAHCGSLPSIDISIPFPTLPSLSIPSIDLPDIPFPTLPSLSISLPSFPIPTGGIPDLSIPIPDLPEFSLPIPSLPLPSLEIPVPTAEVPEVPVPTAEVPEIPGVEVPVPTAEVPEVPVPTAEVPEIPVPTAEVPEVPVPTAEVPEVPSPTEPTYGEEEGPSSMADNASTPAPIPSPEISLPSLPTPEYPETLPKCLNTWLYITDCMDSANTECFCPNSDFVTKVQECLESWSKDEVDASKAVEFFVGLCNPYISENPAITSAIPTGITFPPAPSGVPCQTITRTIVKTMVKPDAPSSMADNSQPAPTVPAEEPEVPAVTGAAPEEPEVPAATGAEPEAPAPTSAPEEPVEEPVEEPITYITEEITETLTIPQVTLVVTSSDAEMIYAPSEPTPAPEPVSSLAGIPTTFVASTFPAPTMNVSAPLETFMAGAGSAVTPTTMLTIAAVAVAVVFQL